MVESSNNRIAEWWNGGKLESLNGGIYRRKVEWWYMVELSSSRVLVWSNRRIVEQANGGIVE